MSINPALSFVMHENRNDHSETNCRNPELFIPGAKTNNNLFKCCEKKLLEIILRKRMIFSLLFHNLTT